MNILKHPIYKSIYDLCLEIEKLPASEQATKCVVMASALEKSADEILTERDQLAANLDRILRHVRCMYCNKEYSFDDSDQLADHIMSCEKSPVVDMVHKMEHRIMDYMDLMNDEFRRILAITDNQEIIGICERAQQVIAQKEPVIKQRDDAIRERDQLAAKFAEMRELVELMAPTFAEDAEDMTSINHALSSDCGKGWLSPERKETIRRKLICLKEVVCTEDSALVQEALDEIQ